VERVSEARRWPLADVAVLLMVAALLWLVPMLISQTRAGAKPLPAAGMALNGADAETLVRAEALALELAAPGR
jgi:hypothetical protein